ncbi:hypothetical protein AMST5_01587 [freshwater sediment metagenome]|uniref:Heme-binding protein n=1 Tax=freshwater sediment metagenome TaxID=556182 RepID=A0AA48LYM9_9ZZZZ
MLKKMLLLAASAFIAPTMAFAAPPACISGVTNTTLQSALRTAVTTVGGSLGLGLNMWATVVNPDGVVCAVAFSSDDAIQGQWLASRVISAQKAFTAATLSLGWVPGAGSASSKAKLALSTANLFTAVQPGGSLFGLQHSNPVAAAVAYGDTGGAPNTNYGSNSDPMLGQVIGGINVFGGGLALYGSNSSPLKQGGVGVSGDTSCTDHLIAWRVRRNLNLDYLSTDGIGGVSGDTAHPDNIVFDLIPQPGQQAGVSPSGWGHPSCGATNAAAKSAASALPPVR